ncbi:hypothetical protein EV179_005475 [Coemansia sp. RSA 487]|nr:hypothetical protein EV179_005475 [Coemansia sp. RSA 487]
MNRLRQVARRLTTPSATGRRFLWAAASSSDPSLATAALQCAENIKKQVSRTKSRQLACLAAKDSCFVLVSQSYPSADIDRVVGLLRQQLGSISKNICFSGTVVDHVVLGGTKRPSIGDGLSVIYNHFSDSDGLQLEVHPFYIGDIHGRQRLREVAVGRWHNKVTDRFKEQNTNHTQWVSGHSSVTQAASHMVLPAELATGIVAPALVDFVLFATDKESRQVLDLLDKHFPWAAKTGVVGSQTPFVNGREYTLFADSHIHDSGMVGFAFARNGQHSSSALAVGESKVSHCGLVPISDALRIVRCKGNVILELENGDAAHSLIASVRKRHTEMTKDTGGESRLFAKIIPADYSGNTSAGTSESRQPVVFQVTGGDPAKGGLALDTLRDLSNGQLVQFMMADAQTVSYSNNESNLSDALLMFGAADFGDGSLRAPHAISILDSSIWT